MRTSALTAVASLSLIFYQPQPVEWTPQTSGVTARLRGVSAVSDSVCWASGSGGTVLRTADGGATWQKLTIPGTDKLDFRDIDAIDARTAYVLSIGAGETSRIFKTVDAGTTWKEQFVNRDPKAFLDAMAFWDANNGVAVSDSVDGRFVILITKDGGRGWTHITSAALPPALPNEGAFAASGTNVAVFGTNHVWIGTGASTQSRVLRSIDRGRTWKIATTPRASGPSSGIFSIAFRDARNGIVVGGNYSMEGLAVDNAAMTSDGGATWTPFKGLTGFRSVVAYAPAAKGAILAVGPSGTDYSANGGKTWTAAKGPGFHAFSFARKGTLGWGVGEKGAIARLQLRLLPTSAPE
jgi:photosystem II stability/assembly factor-like uncharacterized protein